MMNVSNLLIVTIILTIAYFSCSINGTITENEREFGLRDMDDNETLPCVPVDSNSYLNVIGTCPLCLIHGALMFWGYFILMLAGIFVARYVKPYAKWWFYLHIVLMSFAIIIITVSFALAMTIMGGADGVPPEIGGPSMMVMNSHHIIGFITYALTGLQAFIGPAAHFMYDRNRKRPPIFPDMTHWGIGYLTLLLAAVNICLGIWTMTLPLSFAGVFFAFLAAAAILFGAMEIFVRYLFPPPPKKKHPISEDQNVLINEINGSD